MLQIRPSADRGSNKLSWLDSHFTFSFDQYYDPEHVQFRSLRVLNEDVIAPLQGFPMHPHRDMEILTWILEGALEHRDSSGGRRVVRPGELQHWTAGRGVMHSEFNPSPQAPVMIHQDPNLYIARLDRNDEAVQSIKAGRHAWLQVSRGAVRLNATELKAGDGAAASSETEIRVEACEASEVLLFDLA
jgi:quercetin 2,3-dioxygenase